VQAIAIGVNTTSPAYSLAAILAPMALLVGYATPIVLIISFVPMALTSLAFMYLGRRDPDCGTTFSWVSRAIGPRPGFLAGWAIAAAGILVLGSLAETAVTYGLLTFGLDSLAGNRTLVVAAAALLIACRPSCPSSRWRSCSPSASERRSSPPAPTSRPSTPPG
jgi:amino acid transporter